MCLTDKGIWPDYIAKLFRTIMITVVVKLGYYIFRQPCHIVEGSLEVKLPTIWTDGKAEVGRVREEKRRRKKISEEKESEERRCRCVKR